MLIILLAAFQAVFGGLRTVQAQTVQAVFFFAPTCPHCHDVITQYLPSLFEQNGGAPRVSVDATVSDDDRALYLFHNGQLQILLVDASKSIGTELYLASTENQAVPPERSGVPRLVIGDVVLVGSIEIPEQTGELVQQGLDMGGLGWPTVDGLNEALASIPGAATTVVVVAEDSATGARVEPDDSAATDPEPRVVADTAETGGVTPDTTPPAREDTTAGLPVDPVRPVDADTVAEIEVAALPAVEPHDSSAGPSRAVSPVADEIVPDSVAAVVVESSVSSVGEPSDSQSNVPSVFEVVPSRRLSMLENFQLDPLGNSFSVGVLLVLIVSIVVVGMKSETLPTGWGVGFGVPLVTAIGMVVASYLTYIEATGATAVCGPVGDCNTVNQSEWATLFGVLPIGALGLMGYVAIVIAWAASKYASGLVSIWARLSLFAMTIGGTLFSVYLTFLEPFVIGATCAWCLTSSVVITLLMWLSAGSGRDAYARIRRPGPAVG